MVKKLALKPSLSNILLLGQVSENKIINLRLSTRQSLGSSHLPSHQFITVTETATLVRAEEEVYTYNNTASSGTEAMCSPTYLPLHRIKG